MFIEASNGVIVNMNHVRQIVVSEDKHTIIFIMDSNEKIAETYNDEYAVFNILDAIRQECGLWLKVDDVEHTGVAPQVEK